MNFCVFPPMDVYRFVAWAGWAVNPGVVEWLITRQNGKSKNRKDQEVHESNEGTKKPS